MDTKQPCRSLRDELARERTVLACERTLLAYIRTALMLFASGITLIKLFNMESILRLLGYLLLPLSLVIVSAGYIRYRRIRRELRQIEPVD